MMPPHLKKNCFWATGAESEAARWPMHFARREPRASPAEVLPCPPRQVPHPFPQLELFGTHQSPRRGLSRFASAVFPRRGSIILFVLVENCLAQNNKRNQPANGGGAQNHD